MAWSINADNGGGGSAVIWDHCRLLWDQNGIQNFPWFHCRSLTDVNRLIDVGQQEDAPAIGLNIENVVEDFVNRGVSLQDVAQVLARWTGPVHMATLCWVQNGQGWRALSRCVAALEIFIDEVPACQDIDGCITHALEEGLPNVTLMLKTKSPNTPATYGKNFSVCHSLYTADDITPTAQAWQAWEFNGTCIAPKPPNGGGMVPIGDQDGIVAAVNRLRTLDPAGTLLQPDAKGKWPPLESLTVPVKDWKAYDKFQRTLQILKDDHDG
jgi:hypothetical protein